MPSISPASLLSSFRELTNLSSGRPTLNRLPTSSRHRDRSHHPSWFNTNDNNSGTGGSFSISSRVRSVSLQDAIPSRSTALFIVGCLAWYLSSALANNLAKSLLSLTPRQKALPTSERPASSPFPFPVTLTMIQFAFVHVLCGLCGSRRLWGGSVLAPIVKPSWDRIREVGKLSVFSVVGHICSALAISRVPVATVHTIKALAPLVTVISYSYLFGVDYSSRTYISLVPLTLGVMLACSGFSFNADDVVGFLAALGSTCVFVAQNIYSKKLLREGERAKEQRQLGVAPAKMDQLSLLFYSSGCSFVLMIPFVLYYDSHVLFSKPEAELHPGQPTTSLFNTCTLLLGNGTMHFLQSILAFSVLSLVSPVTYSIASLLKRVFVIVLAIFWFHQKVTLLQLLGIAMTFGGLWLYNDAKTREEVEKGEAKLRKREEGGQMDGILPTRMDPVSSVGLDTGTGYPRMVRQHPTAHSMVGYQPPRTAKGIASGPKGGLPSPPYSDKE